MRHNTGKLRDVGIEREPQKRVPARAYHRLHQVEPDPEHIALARRRHEDEREDAKRRKKEKAYQKERRLAKAGFVPAEHLAHACRQRDSARRELAVRDAEARSTVQVVKEVPVYLEPPDEQKPASAKAVKTMLAMAAERGMEIADEAPMTVGTVGATIRHLTTIPLPGVKPMSEPAAPPPPPTPKASPLRLDPATTVQDRRRILGDMGNELLLATYRVSRDRYSQVKQQLADGGGDTSLRRELLELEVAGGAMSTELTARGLMHQPTARPTGPSPNTRQRGRDGESR